MTKKDEKIYEEYHIEFDLRFNSRENLMKKAVETFISEKPGYWKDGKKHVTRFKYFVEKVKDGRRIYLFRPTFLNKGIDFQVFVERLFDEKDKKPSHKNIFADLEIKKEENPKGMSELSKAIDRVWNCEEPDEVLKDLKVDFRKGFPVELLLKILKWLFIEQDITYWNYDGRGMLRMAIDEKLNNFDFTNKFTGSSQERLP